MTEQAKARHVRERVHAFDLSEILSDRIELCGRGDQGAVAICIQPVLLQCGAVDAYAERLGQDQLVADLPCSVGEQFVGMHEAQRDQSVDRLLAVDRVTASNRHTRRRTHGCAARQDLADHLHRHHAHRHAHDREGEDRRCPHGIDVREGVGRGDAAEFERIVDHRHEEVRRRHQRLGIVQTPHGGVV